MVKDIELLVGQNATIPLTPEAGDPERERHGQRRFAARRSRSRRGSPGNVDARQMEEIPIAGRNWQQLATLVKGITMNTITNQPGVSRDAAFQLNLDGQNITQRRQQLRLRPADHQPRRHRRVPDHHQSVRRDDGALDRHPGPGGHQGRVRTTRAAASTASSATSRLNAADAYASAVLPYSNQQIGGTVGGPIIKDKMHYLRGVRGRASAEHARSSRPSALPGQQFEIPTETRSAQGARTRGLSVADRGSPDRSQRLLAKLHVARHQQRAERGYQPAPTTRTSPSANWSHVRQPEPAARTQGQLLSLSLALRGGRGRAARARPTAFRACRSGTPSNYPQNWFEDFTHVALRPDGAQGLARLQDRHARFAVGKDSGDWQKGQRGTMQFSRLPADATTRFPAQRRAGSEPAGTSAVSTPTATAIHDQLLPRTTTSTSRARWSPAGWATPGRWRHGSR